MENSIYKQATQKALRFEYSGLITTEDLWALPLTTLDSIYKRLNAKLQASKEDSLLNTTTPQDEVLELQIAIIKDIVETKLEEKAAAQSKAKVAKEKSKIMAALAEKQDAKFANMTEEELRKALQDLEA